MSQKNNFKTFYVLSIAWQLGFLIAVPIAGFIFLGAWVDNFFETKPLFLLSGLLVGIVITVYEVYHLLIPLISDKINSKEKND